MIDIDSLSVLFREPTDKLFPGNLYCLMVNKEGLQTIAVNKVCIIGIIVYVLLYAAEDLMDTVPYVCHSLADQSPFR